MSIHCPKSGAFSYISSKDGGGDHERVLTCLTANMIWNIICFGYLEDERFKKQWNGLLSISDLMMSLENRLMNGHIKDIRDAGKIAPATTS